ncbi:autotransporter domain-containing protein [Anaerobiospirillum sp. NML120448]|uniref:autotransporter domain-containing protein n=1 Tax=Anaerobiospirillum sp. NML120448 TaxID=2932816 RepID=UPI001FF3632C|nr:autotransporter domain-containing protein [Anaerobiospirillum sp. NML120448]MCK0515398.1 autotransporter domain-containing protein [Anaerobiospirillum sp. NML120448]
MKQTNNAIKFLMAQYRAIFNNAYFKGLATAALVTVAMAAGQANAATLTGSLVSDAANAQDIIATGSSDSLTVSGGDKFAKTITVQKGAQLTISGGLTSLGDVNVNGGTLIVQGPDTALLLGSVKEPAAKAGGAKQHYESDLNVSSGSTLKLNSGNIGVANFDIAGSTITLTSGGTGGTNLTAYGVGAYQDDDGPKKYGKAVGNLTDVTATINGGSNITAIGTLNVSGSALDKSKITLNGNVATGTSQTNFAYLEGSKQLNISKTTITVSGDNGSALSSRDLNLADSKLDVTSGTLTIGTDYDVKKAASDTNSGTAISGTIDIKNSTISLASSTNLNFGAEGSAASVTFSGTNNITNKGTVNFYTPKISMSAADLNALVESGKVDFKESSVANVAGDLDLTKKVLAATGALNTTNFALESGKTLKLASDGTVTLGKAFAVNNFTVEAGVLKLTPDTSNSANTFTQTSGSLVALNGLTSANETTLKEVIVSGSTSAKTTLTLGKAGTTNGSVTKVDKLTVKGEASGNEGTLNIYGKWDLTGTELNVGASGAANLAKAANVTIKNLTVDTNGALNITDGSLLTVDGTVTTAENKVALTENSKLSVKYAEANKSSALAKVKLDGSSTLVLTGYNPDGGKITLKQFGDIKSKFIGDTGLLKLDGVEITSGVAQNADVTYTQAQSGTGAADVFSTNTVTGVNTAVTGSNDWGTVKLEAGQTELSVAAGGAVTLNGNGANKLVADSTGATDAGVKLASGSILTVEANGTIKEVVAANDGEGKFIVGGNGTANTVTVTNNLGSDSVKLDKVNVIADSALTVKNVYAKTLDLGGTLQATSVTLDDNSSITGSLKADSLVLANTKTLAVGEGADNGLLEVKSLDLKGGKLVLDPGFGTPASVAAINQPDAAPDDIVYVKANGDIGVGKNSVFAVGLTADAALEVLRSNGYLDENTSLIENKLGSAIVLDQGMSIAAGDAVFLDSTGTTDTLSKKITDKTTTLNNSGGYMELGANTGLVITGKLFDNATTQNKEIIQFAGTTNTTLQLNDGSKLVFDVTDAFGGDSIKLTNATTLSSNGTVNIEAANGMLVGTLDTTNKGVTFAIAQDAKDKLYNQSTPVKDLTYDVMAGNYKNNRDENGVAFIGAVNGQDGGKAVEETARLAVYGGAIQATNLAQQAANDAVVERMSRANPNGSLVFANNAQGGGLWLSPVYKSLESDSFDADGVDYGVDADLTGLVLGGDFTSESGVRAGAYFNFGSASVDGQGVGDQVSNDADYFGFGLYTGMTFGQMSLVADAGFTQVSNDVEQNINHKDFSKAKASFDSSSVTLGLRGEYKLSVATMDVTPHLGVRYTRLAVDGYDAKVDGYTVATTDVDTMQMFAIPFGVTISKDIVAGSWTVKPVFDLTLTANAGDTDTKLDTTFIGTKTIGLTSEAFDSFTYGATVGIDAKYGENFSVGLNTNYVGSSNTDEFGVMGNVRYMF